MKMMSIPKIVVLLVVPGFSVRHRRKIENNVSNVCSSIGCGAAYDPSRACQCNDLCSVYGNCCPDYDNVCAACSTFGCGAAYDRTRPCQCNDLCGTYGNCCSDYSALCEGSGGSCSGRCGSGLDPNQPCQCNSACETFGDCCPDYNSICQGSGGSCSGRCGSALDPNQSCQCNSACVTFGDCCPDYNSICGGSPSPVPTPTFNPSPVPAPTPAGVNASVYWQGVDMNSMLAIQARLRNGSISLSYTPGLWNAYREVWVNLPGGCQGGVYDVYSTRCWTPGTGQCGNYGSEGDCYNREHSWPQSWWGGATNAATTDMYLVLPSDGYVNGRRSSWPFGEVNSPSYTSSEGHRVGSCSSAGIAGTCFEPTDRVKGALARANLYVAVRYMNEFSCCSNGVVNGATMTPAYQELLLRWSSEHPPAAWEIEFNNRAQAWQGNRNPFIDYPEVAQQVFG